MTFWSGETLRQRLPTLMDPFNPENVDCAAYTLTIGHEIYVSPTDTTPDPRSRTKRRLEDGEAFTIPPGQFAFLLTEERVSVPPDALGLISIRAKTKFRGLVNVSGFHVDPGFRGQLIFSVFNAGPATIHLEQGQPTFLIWFASLDQTSDSIRLAAVQEGVRPELINSISGELQSFEGLANRIRSVEASINDRLAKVEREHAVVNWAAMATFGVALALAVGFVQRSCAQSAPLSRTQTPREISSEVGPQATPGFHKPDRLQADRERQPSAGGGSGRD